MESDPVIVDLGTGYLKVGLSCSTVPTCMIQNAVGRPILRSDESLSNVKLKDIMICDEIYPVRKYLDVTMPVEHGVVMNWEDETMVLDYVFRNKLKIDPKDHAILVSEAPQNNLDNRKKMMEVLFEKFNFPQFQIAPQALLVLYAQGLVTGIVLDSGDGVSHVMPIAENYILEPNIGRVNIAGRDVTEHLIKLLTLRGYTFHKSSDFDIVATIKEKLCFISADLEVDRRIASETTTYVVPYSLPDGRIIKVSGERFEAGEVLFHPELAGREEKGLSDLLFSTIMSCPINLRKTLFESIVVSGGTSMFPGLSTRINNDLMKYISDRKMVGNKDKSGAYKVKIEDPPNRRFLVYLGATVLANITKDKANSWITKRQYNEEGVDNIMRRWKQ